MIHIENLSVSFKNRIILDKINLTVARGSAFVLFGKNGSGKTVLLKAIAGLIRDYKGIIEINGNNINNYKRSKSYYELSIGYVFQKGGLFDSMNVFENIAFPLRRRGRKEDEIWKIVLYTLERLGLSGSEEKFPSELSGGMQKRLGIGRAICQDPNIILYDDPTAGLDPVLSDAISDILCDIKETNKSTSIVVTHDTDVAKKIADVIGLLYNGKLVFLGSNDDFFNGNNIYANQLIQGSLEGPIDIY